MTTSFFRWRSIGVWLLLSAAGVLWLGRQEYQAQRDRFLQGASIAHRMLSQKAVQHEAVLDTLSALSHPPAPERLLPGLQPAMGELQALGWQSPQGWLGSQPEPAGFAAALARAQASSHAITLPIDSRQYWLIAPSSWSMLINAQSMLAPGDISPDIGGLTLAIHADPLALRASSAKPGPVLDISKPLGSASQPFRMTATRTMGPADWPWLAWAAWLAASAVLVGATRYWQHSRRHARRQAEQARMAALARLSTLGEMAAGIAHELNQPLTAILAHTRAAERMLDDPDEAAAVRQALSASRWTPMRWPPIWLFCANPSWRGGMGLGLTLCETLAGAMDGQMSVRNRPEGGACFTLSLPLEQAS